MAIDRSFFPSLRRMSARSRSLRMQKHRDGGIEAHDAHRCRGDHGDNCVFCREGRRALIAGLSGVVIVTTSSLQRHSADCAVLVCTTRVWGFTALAVMVENEGHRPPHQPSSVDSVTMGHGVCIGEDVAIGKGTIIEPGAGIHHGVEIGRNCRVGANAVLSHCRLDDGVHIGAGCVVGGSGFGFEVTPDGPVMLPHVGSVQIGEGSSAGAGCTIDRGTLGMTRIGASVMIDNLVHIAHNCIVGDRAVLAAQVGLAGGAIIGEGAMLAGQAGVGAQVTVGKRAVVMAQSGVTKDVPEGTTVVGFPAEETRKVWRERAAVRRLLGSSRNEES